MSIIVPSRHTGIGLSSQLTGVFPPLRFNISPPLTAGWSEGVDAFKLFSKQLSAVVGGVS